MELFMQLKKKSRKEMMTIEMMNDMNNVDM